MTKKNPSLEEFSSARFNQLRKALVKYYDAMKPIFEKNHWDESKVEAMQKDTLAYLDKKVDEAIAYYSSDKPRLEFVLDYMILNFYSSILIDVLTKSYRQEAIAFKEREEALNYETANKFLKETKHWLYGFLKPMNDIIAKRKVEPDQLEYFASKKNYTTNLTEGAAHFFSLFPLPEYRELKKIKWETFETNGKELPLKIFDFINQAEYEINLKLKDKAILPSKEVDADLNHDEDGRSIHGQSAGKFLRKGKTLIEFADRSKWVDLQVPACSLEAASLEHCGNNYRASETNLRVWSFRTPTDQEGFYVGRLTFIYNTDTKMIGEAKARNNQKPQSKYHPYIVELLLLPIVDGLEQGRHATDKDFAFADLNDELLKKLIEEKPTLFEKSRVGRSVIISRKLQAQWEAAYKRVTGQKAPDIEKLKFDS